MPTIYNYYVSEYDDFILYAEGFNWNSKVFVYDKTDKTWWYARLVQVTEYDLGKDEPQKEENFMGVVVSDYEGEFVTDDGIYYVLTIITGGGIPIKNPPSVIYNGRKIL